MQSSNIDSPEETYRQSCPGDPSELIAWLGGLAGFIFTESEIFLQSSRINFVYRPLDWAVRDTLHRDYNTITSPQIFPTFCSINKVRNPRVANRSVFKLFLTELNPTILKIFHVSQSVTE